MPLTNYGEVLVLTQLKNSGPMYLGLLLVPGDESGTATEPTSGGYARMLITFTEPSLSGDTTAIKNSARIEFPTATATWGQVVAWGIFDAQTAGKMILHGDLSAGKEIQQDDTMLIHENEVTVSVD